MKATVAQLVTAFALLSWFELASSVPFPLDAIEEVERETDQTPRLSEEMGRTMHGYTPIRSGKFLVSIPYRLPDPDALPTVRPESSRSGLSRWIPKLRPSRSSNQPPASNEDMARLLERRPYRVYLSQDLLAITGTATSFNGQQVVELPGGEFDRDVMTMMTRKSQPFYVQGRGGKIWHFTKSGQNSFVYTDKIDVEDLVRIKKALGGQWSNDISWWSKASGGSRRRLWKAWSKVKAFHFL